MVSADMKYIALNSIFGWIVGGTACTQFDKEQVASCRRLHSVSDNVDHLLVMEDYPGDAQMLTTEEQQASDHFIKHTIRDEEGRYGVRLPRLRECTRFGTIEKHCLETLPFK